MEEGFKMFFVYSFLGIAASILIYALVRLFGGLKPIEINTDGEALNDKIKMIESKPAEEGKPRGFWRSLLDNVKPYDPRILHKRAMRKLDMDFACGLLNSNIRTMDRTGGHRMK
jgi:hypothetical protein